MLANYLSRLWSLTIWHANCRRLAYLWCRPEYGHCCSSNTFQLWVWDSITRSGLRGKRHGIAVGLELHCIYSDFFAVIHTHPSERKVTEGSPNQKGHRQSVCPWACALHEWHGCILAHWWMWVWRLHIWTLVVAAAQQLPHQALHGGVCYVTVHLYFWFWE